MPRAPRSKYAMRIELPCTCIPDENIPLPPSPQPDSSFSESYVGAQIIVSTDNINAFTNVTGWLPISIGEYNTGQFDEATGIFTPTIEGKYLFTLRLQLGRAFGGDPPTAGSVMGIRLTDVAADSQIAEKRINAFTAYDINSGISIDIAHQVLLDSGQAIRPQINYFSNDPLTIPIDPMQGASWFGGFLLRDTTLETSGF